ncbi:hypothetical protein CANARDRAFT_237203 [[Candida] arabinofermentans NRRL YB-2248]|uniref:Protein AF-9 homolog n=1 Tax=[Candida] arabinofermentans NRRL YB-2248 TaxID=983967 RepID=A0A1E4SWL1_9ASCO|nr:hypothetical protein CANARDRAFT_237203 [[Candida] arabinofermentans NRRL YB-2248]
MAPPTTNSKRLKNISISKPIIYGNTAQKISESNPLPEGAPSDHTHTWKVFVSDLINDKSANTSSDLASFVKKVVFKLHDTYPNSTRSIEEPPFEVNETGWGEFEIIIKIYFNSDCGEKNITFYHHLKLHPYGQKQPQVQKQITGDVDNTEFVQSILYDEIVFNEPTEKMFKQLTLHPSSFIPYDSKELEIQNNEIKHNFTKIMERDELDRIEKCLEKIKNQYMLKKDEFKKLEKERELLID